MARVVKDLLADTVDSGTLRHIVDRRAAELFYEAFDYYPAFEAEFDHAYDGIQALIDRDAAAAQDP